MMCIALQHDLNVLHCLLSYGSGTCHFISDFLSSFLQLKIKVHALIHSHIFYNVGYFTYNDGWHKKNRLREHVKLTSGRFSVGIL